MFFKVEHDLAYTRPGNSDNAGRKGANRTKWICVLAVATAMFANGFGMVPETIDGTIASTCGDADSCNAQLEANGFISLPSILDEGDVAHFLKGFRVNGSVFDYGAAHTFGEAILLPAVATRTGWSGPATSHFFRFSNHTNTDAGTLHRDIKYLGDKVYPIYTVLFYINGGTLGVIPGAHKQTKIPIASLITEFFREETIEVPPRGVVVLHSNMLHRALHSRATGSRGLIQYFETHPSYASQMRNSPNMFQSEVPNEVETTQGVFHTITQRGLSFALSSPSLMRFASFVDFPASARTWEPVNQGIGEEKLAAIRTQGGAIFYETHSELPGGASLGRENVYVYPHGGWGRQRIA